MKFLISQELTQGNYFVKVMLKEFSEDDQKKASKFGMPTLSIRYKDGRYFPIPINEAGQYPLFPFVNQKDADDYAVYLKKQINELKNNWENLKDTWSNRWSGFLGQETGIYKWEIALDYSSCRSLFLRLCTEVNHSRCLPVKVIMPSFFVVELKVAGQSIFHLRHGSICLQINVLVLNAFP